MRGNIIEELYYGNVDPQDHGYHPKSPVKKASDSLNDLEEKLTEQLADENKTLFLSLLQRLRRIHGRIRAGHLHHRLPPRRTVYDGYIPERRRPV